MAYGRHVPVNRAMTAGKVFLETAADLPGLKSAGELQLVFTAATVTAGEAGITDSIPLFYVFGTGDKGFIIIAGDDNVLPVLGYSATGSFKPDSLPQNVAKWLEGYKSQIRYIITNRIPANTDITEKWNALSDGGISYSGQATTTVNPLLQTTWNQSPYYNSLCPGGSVTGCVATAMAQIMKYWNYPEKGSGFHSYNHDQYGTLSANFGGTTYNWASMPNAVNGANSAVATLMYQVGVSVDMGYSPESSGAYVISAASPVVHCSEYALKTYFGYKTSMQGLKRSDYTDNQWLQMMKTDLAAGKPVLYAGFGSGGGHCFVADGFDRNDYIHMNWGWGGYYDGYFPINALNPSGVGTGGGSGGFNSGHQALFGIEPIVTTSQKFDLSLYDNVRPSTTSISYGQSFTVSTNIANFGTGSFTGDYCAAVFDNSYAFVEYVDSLTGYSLQAGYAYTNNLVFTSKPSFTLLPGSYYIGIFYRPVGQNWFQVSDNGSYTNLVPVTVVHPSDIELYSAITVTPAAELTQGEPASVNLNLINNGANTFKGEYFVGLYTLDGDWAQDIGTMTESNGLQHNYVYLSPFLTFSSPEITVEPGTYLLAVMHNPNGTGWQLTGSTNYQNPIKVKVVEPAIRPDRFENNNSVGQSFQLTASFSADKANCNTEGSNCHISSDNDFFNIVLPAGFNYTLSPRLHDSNKSGNGKSYTLDGLFSYSFDGTKWSSAYDDVIAGTVSMRGGGTIYFHVAPYFAGETGSYLLDINLSRTNASGIADVENGHLFSVYPNPASEQVFIDLKGFSGEKVVINLIGLDGRKLAVSTFTGANQVVRMDLQGVPEGTYIIELNTGKEKFTQNIVVTQ